MSKVTEKNTKKEIIEELSATQKLLKEAKKQLADERKKFGEDVKTKKEPVYLNDVMEIGVVDIRKQRDLVTSYFMDIENQVGSYKEGILELIRAQKAMEKEIEDTKGIEVEAETLQELVRANAIERERYKEEMDAEAMNWRVKLESLEKQYDDRNEALKKEYNRKLEEWSYDFAHNKKKELNKWELEFNVKKEKESETLKERWRELNADRKELQNEQEAFDKMTEEVESFPARLQEAVDKAKADVKARLEQSYHFKSEAIKKDCEINTKVLEEQVKSLTLKADELKAQNIDLREALEQANSRVQIIAKEAITGSASQKFTINTGNEKEGK